MQLNKFCTIFNIFVDNHSLCVYNVVEVVYYFDVVSSDSNQ